MEFHVKHGVIVTGGKHPWAPDDAALQEVDGKLFFAVRKRDRGFASLLGLNMSRRTPWEGVSFLFYIVNLRDKEVDRLIANAHIADADPMAEEGQLPALKRPRSDLMQGVAHTIDIVIPPMGELASRSMRVRSDKKRGNGLVFELIAENLAYFSRAVHMSWPHAERKRAARMGAFHESAPNVLKKEIKFGSLMLYCRWTDTEGVMHNHSKRVPSVGDSVDNDIAMVLAKQVQEFYDQNNVEFDEGDAGDAEAEPELEAAVNVAGECDEF